MKKPISLFIFLLICIGCKDKQNYILYSINPMVFDTVYGKPMMIINGDTGFISNTINFRKGTHTYYIDTCVCHSYGDNVYKLTSTFTPVLDSSTYYLKKYKHFLFLKTKAKNYNEIQRYSDSILRYAELISKIKK